MSTPHGVFPTAPALPPELAIRPVGGPVNFEIAVPGSKSITNRAMICGALADGPVTLTGGLFADDPHYMAEGLRALGFSVQADPASGRIRIEGQGGRIPAADADLFVGNAGTAMRFLSAFVCLGRGRYRLDGTARMRERPIADLIDGLRGVGVKARCEFENGCPPVIVEAAGLPGGTAQVDGSRSSQYVSALLMAAPYAASPLTVEVTGEFVSRPYVELTLRTMSDFGLLTATEGQRKYSPTHGVTYRPGVYAIEGDATAASYFLAAAAILGGRACVTNLRADSPQGDVHFASILGRMGCRVRQGILAGGRGIEVSRDPKTPLKAVHVDLNDMPDVAQTLAAVALFAEGTSHFINIGNLRIKETDRLKALAQELTRLGADVEEGPDELEITPGPPKDAAVETYDDHRMAMALALVGLGRPGVTVKNPACVAKTYPGYFQDLEKLSASRA
ncbi:MAG: 3-phosphoshikimate 1-carboxyvinyltransferase [Planctomycetota bacterium]|nr:3-phosphoshikimate 1-carboxyvinyltransferase [Planctomycetota bacterium]